MHDARVRVYGSNLWMLGGEMFDDLQIRGFGGDICRCTDIGRCNRGERDDAGRDSNDGRFSWRCHVNIRGRNEGADCQESALDVSLDRSR